jgi:hypothetical protein
VNQHSVDEERELFSVAQEVLSTEESSDLAERFLSLKEREIQRLGVRSSRR